MKQPLIQLPFYSFLMKICSSEKSAADPSCASMLTRCLWCFTPSGAPGPASQALSTLYSRDTVTAESTWQWEEVAEAAEEEESCFVGSRRHLLFTEADHSPSMLKWKQSPLPEKICELTGVQRCGESDGRGLIHALAASSQGRGLRFWSFCLRQKIAER